MKENKPDTEKNILDSARRVFQRKGMGGTRMQEIADEAKINKSLLHYYFRSKQKLFDAVFKDTAFEFMFVLKNVFNSDEELKVKIPKIVEIYIDYLKKKPYVVTFLLRELQSEPKIFMKIIETINPKSLKIFTQIENEIKKGKIKPINAEHLFINILSLTIFPIMAKPIILVGLMNGNNEKFETFVEERKTQVVDFIFSAIEIR